MKKHFTLFFIYSAVIIAGLSLFLVFHNKNPEKPPNNTEHKVEDNNTNNNDSVESDEDNNNHAGNIIYATKLTLNCARAIDIETNSSVEIIGKYLTIEPANANLTITITAETGKIGDLSFTNNTITSKDTGKYRIRFSSFKNSTSEISDTLVVNVKENLPDLVQANLSILTMGESKNVEDVFKFDNSITNKTFQVDEKISYSDNTLTANEIGESVVIILYDIGMFRYKHTSKFTIKDIPLYKIIITEVSTGAVLNGNAIEYSCEVGKSFKIVYATLNREEEYVNQFVNISLDNTTVASYTLTEPVITVKCLSKGSVNLTITCAEDIESKLTLTIKFV